MNWEIHSVPRYIHTPKTHRFSIRTFILILVSNSLTLRLRSTSLSEYLQLNFLWSLSLRTRSTSRKFCAFATFGSGHGLLYTFHEILSQFGSLKVNVTLSINHAGKFGTCLSHVCKAWRDQFSGSRF